MNTIKIRLSLLIVCLSLVVKCCAPAPEGIKIVERIHVLKYVYSNSSARTIKITKWMQDEISIHNLASRETIEFKSTFPEGCTTNNINQSSPNCLLIRADSIKIEFEDSKFYILEPDDTFSINIFKHENYDSAELVNGISYKYSFTAKDYLYAK